MFRAWALKESLRLIFTMEYNQAKEELDKWITWAQRCRIMPFVKLQKKIKRHYDAILASIRCELSNARIEATNNKIKLVIRMAYGFRNTRNMLNTVLLKCDCTRSGYPGKRRKMLPRLLPTPPHKLQKPPKMQ